MVVSFVEDGVPVVVVCWDVDSVKTVVVVALFVVVSSCAVVPIVVAVGSSVDSCCEEV